MSNSIHSTVPLNKHDVLGGVPTNQIDNNELNRLKTDNNIIEENDNTSNGHNRNPSITSNNSLSSNEPETAPQVNMSELIHTGKFNDETMMNMLPYGKVRQHPLFSLLLLFLISLPFWVVATNRVEPYNRFIEIPVFMTISWYFIGSWLFGRLAGALRLPPAFGYLLSGFCLQFFMDSSFKLAKPTIQTAAFLIVLTRAGLEIRPHDLTRTTIAMGTLPAICEIIGVAFYGVMVLDFPLAAGLILGTSMTPLGDGLVIPKLQEFKALKFAHIPTTMFTAAPLEAALILFLYSVFQSLAHPHTSEMPLWANLILIVPVKLVLSILFAACVAFIFAQLAANRVYCVFNRRKVFTGSSTEELLFLLAAVYLIYAIGAESPIVVPLTPHMLNESILQGDVMVIAVAYFYAQMRKFTVHGVEDHLTHIWMFGALFLFTSLGSNITPGTFLSALQVVPCLFVGFLCRFLATVGIALFMPLDETRKVFRRNLETNAGRWKIAYEILFSFICVCPRATLQGQLAGMPAILGLFDPVINEKIKVFTTFTLALMAPVGAVVLDLAGKELLSSIKYIDTEQAKITGIVEVFDDDHEPFPIIMKKKKKTGVSTKKRPQAQALNNNIIGAAVSVPLNVVNKASSVFFDAIGKFDKAAGISNGIGKVAGYSTFGMNANSDDPTAREVSASLKSSVQNLAMYDPTGMISPEVNDAINEDEEEDIMAHELENIDEEPNNSNDIEMSSKPKRKN